MNKQDIVSFIKQERKKQKLSQQELAVKAGIKRYQQIAEIEKGLIDFGVGVLIKVINVLDYTLYIMNPASSLKEDIPVSGVFDFSKVEPAKVESTKSESKKTVHLPFKRIKKQQL